MVRKGVLVLMLVFFMGLASAVDVQLAGNSVTISDVEDLYAYEVILGHTGDIDNVVFSGFLSQDGKQTTSGYLEDDGLIVYESRLDPDRDGISGSGILFDVTTTGGLSLESVLLVYKSGKEETLNLGDGSDDEDEEEEEEPDLELEIESVDLEFSPDTLVVDVSSDGSVTREILIYNQGDEDVSLKVETEGLRSTVEVQEEIYVSAGQSKTLDVTINGNSRRAVAGRIFFLYDGIPVGEVPVLVNTKTDDFLFDVSVSLVNLFNNVRQGDNLRAQINLIQLGEREETDVTIYYSIKDYSGENYLSENERELLSVYSEKTVVREFETFGFPPGDYVLGVDVVYEGGFSTTTTQFRIDPSVSFGPVSTGLTGKQARYFGMALGVILVLIIILTASYFIKRNVQENSNRSRKNKRR